MTNQQSNDQQQSTDQSQQQGRPNLQPTQNRGRKFTMPGWMFVVIGLVVALIAFLFFFKGNSTEETAESDAISNVKTSSENFKKVTISETKEPELEPINNDTTDDTNIDEKFSTSKKSDEEAAKYVETDDLDPLPNNMYSDNGTGKKELTREEKIFKSMMMSDGGKSQLYKEPREQQDVTREDGKYHEGTLTDDLKSVKTPQVTATRIHPKKQPVTLSKGTHIGCVLKTRMDTSVPGMTTCQIMQDVYSMDGRTLLIEKGSSIVGEYKSAVQNGLDRIFVLWTQIRTTNGINIDVNSPATDQIGGAGMGGQVDHHWFRRFGSALMFSIVGDAFQFGINSANSHTTNGDVTYNQTSDAMTEIVKEAMAQSGNIPPTLIKNQGERVGITVARDVDFSSVYKLKYRYENYYK